MHQIETARVAARLLSALETTKMWLTTTGFERCCFNCMCSRPCAREEATPTVMHRDLKPSNVFISCPGPGGRAVVADFGLARWMPHSGQAMTGETGTYLYMAPEVIRHEPYTGLADVYSFGVMLNELVSCQVPYLAMHITPLQVAFAVADGGLRPTVPSACNPGRGLIKNTSTQPTLHRRSEHMSIHRELDRR